MDWRNLASVLVNEIADHLLDYDVSEYICLRAACYEWRKVTADPRDLEALSSRLRPRHWTMLSNNTDGVYHRFLNRFTGACTLVNLPELSTHHLEASTEGLLLLRDKVSHAVRLLNPLTRALIDLPPITKELGYVYTTCTKRTQCISQIIYVGISDETSPTSVVLMMREVCFITYAKPNDTKWTLMSDSLLGSIRYLSVSTLQGSVYLATYEGNILEIRLRPEPRVMVVVMHQPFSTDITSDVVSYLIPADDLHRHHGMLLVRHYHSLQHLSNAERRNIKRRKKREVIRTERCWIRERWHLIHVLEVNLESQRVIKVEDIGCHRALFVGPVACFSLSTKRFPSVLGNAVYIGADLSGFKYIGVLHLGDMSIDPPFEFSRDDLMIRGCIRDRKLVPIARPCTVQEYLVCCVGVKGGIKD